MNKLVILFLLVSFGLYGQGIEPSSLQPTPYKGGIMVGVVQSIDEFTGDTLYMYQHSDTTFVKIDSLVYTDSLRLYTSDGIFSTYISDTTTVNGTGVATRVAFWTGSKTLGSNSNLFWDNTNNILKIKNIPYTSYATDQISVGTNAGIGATSAPNSIYFGANAGQSATSAEHSNFFGNNAGAGATSATYSNFFGFFSGNSAASAFNSNFFGNESGREASSASYSNFYGPYAGKSATSASFSNFFGSNAGNSATSASYSNFFGTTSGYFATNASNSNFFGNESGREASSASYCNFFGYKTGSPGIGSNNVIIGTNISLPNSTANALNIGSVLFGTGLWSDAFAKNTTGSTGGKIGILTNSPAQTIHVQGTARITDLITDTPTKLVGANNAGDLNEVTISNGLTLSGSTITANINGTTNRVPKFTTQYAIGNSQIYTIGDTLVGINQSNPQYHLDVTGKFRVTNRTGTAATGAGFTADGQLIAYSLDTAASAPNTYVSSGTSINVTGAGNVSDPYVVNNTAPENTHVKDSQHLDFSELTSDTITAVVKVGSIGSSELASTAVSAGSYTLANITIDQDGRITTASNGVDNQGVISITAVSPLTGGNITDSGSIAIQNANGSQSGALTSMDWNTFNNKESPLTFNSPLSRAANAISIPAATTSVSGHLTSTDWNTFNNKENAITAGTTSQYWRGDKTFQTLNTSVVPESGNLYFTDARARSAISLTTSGTSGAATYNSGTGVLNVPNYATPTVLTSGSVPFGNGTATLQQDNSRFFWDNTNKRMGIGTNVPQTGLHITAINAMGNGIMMQNGNSLATNNISQHILSNGTGTGFTSTNRYYALKNIMTSSTTADYRVAYWNGTTEVDRLKINDVGAVTIPQLATGGGTQMVTTNANGDLSRTTIPVNTDAQNISVGTKSGANIPINISGGTGINFTDGVGTSGVVNSSTSLSVDLVGAANSVKARVAGTSGTLSDVSLSASQLVGRGSGNVQAIGLNAGLSVNGSNLEVSTMAWGMFHNSQSNEITNNTPSKVLAFYDDDNSSSVSTDMLNSRLTLVGGSTSIYEIEVSGTVAQNTSAVNRFCDICFYRDGTLLTKGGQNQCTRVFVNGSDRSNFHLKTIHRPSDSQDHIEVFAIMDTGSGSGTLRVVDTNIFARRINY